MIKMFKRYRKLNNLKLNKSGFKYRDPIEKVELIYNSLKDTEYLTAYDLARKLGCCTRTIYIHTNWMVSKGFIVMIKIGRNKIFRQPKRKINIRKEMESMFENKKKLSK